EEEKKYLKNIKSSGNALLNLINDLLDFSKIESGKFVITEDEYEPLELVEDLKPIFMNRAGDKKIELKYEIDSQLPQVLWGDGARIRQIIINLVNNAIKFTEKGYVKLSIQVQQSRQNEVEICVSVQDSGQGIKKEDLSKLFDAFTQVDLKKNHTKEGTGLGLAICNQLVELMGGELHVESEYGEGSNFYFVMWQKVIANEKNADSTEEGETGFVFTAPDAKILLVDDNEINREVAKALLEPLMMQIDEAENGLEALQMVQQKEYDLVFMDHYMPVMDGVEAAMKIRQLEDEHNQKMPILALTADAIAGEKDKFFEAGMNEVLSKPIQIQEVCERIHHYLKKELIVEK
ncbi:MAG: response regulator, partial [Eubacterium sp.]|nr:response regulator [Eubacterium sp.]